jgi:hypothetical protein
MTDFISKALVRPQGGKSMVCAPIASSQREQTWPRRPAGLGFSPHPPLQAAPHGTKGSVMNPILRIPDRWAAAMTCATRS